MSGHIPSEWLSAYLDGEIEPAEARALSSHLDSCAAWALRYSRHAIVCRRRVSRRRR